MKKRLLALVLALGMVCTLLPAASAETAQPAGSGTAADPYRIGTKEELYWFAGQVNGGEGSACAVLTADITVNENVLKADGTLADDASGFTPWTPIGSGGAPYTGTFDGRSHTVSGLYLKAETSRYNLGFFGSVDGEGAVKNLTIAGSYFYGGDRVGAVVGHLNNATVENCRNVGSTVYAVSNSGGIVGYASGDTAAICRCSNSGLLRVATGGLYRVGGIVGQVANGAVTYCVNTGTLKCATSGEYVGGIAGDVGSGAAVRRCGNTGEVRGYNFVGGLCGNVASGATVESSWNARAIYCTGDYGNEGEIAGNRSAVVTGCYYVRGAENMTGHGTAKTQAEFDDGTVCAAIGFHNARDGVCVLCGAKVTDQITGVSYDASAHTLTAAWSGGDGQFLAGCYDEDNVFVKVVAGTRSGNTLTFEGVPSCCQYKVFVLDPTGHAPLGVAGNVQAEPYTTGYAEGLSIPTLDAGISAAAGMAAREFLRANYIYNDMDAILSDPANTGEDGTLTDEARARVLNLVGEAQTAWDSVTDSAAVLNAVTKAEIGELEARTASMEEQAELLWWWDSEPDPMDEARKWAQELTDAYDAIDGAKKLQTLAVSLGCDAKTAQKKLNQAQAILQGKYALEEGAADEAYAIADALKTTGKVAACVAGGAAVMTGVGAAGVVGYTTLGEGTGLTLAGADAILELGDKTAKIIGLCKDTPTSYEKLQDMVGAANLVFGLFTFKGAENYERLGVISDIKDGGLKKIVELFDFSEKDGKITATVKTSELPEGMTKEEVKAFQKALEDLQKKPDAPEKTDREKEQELKDDLNDKKPTEEELKKTLEEKTGSDDLDGAKDDLTEEVINKELQDDEEKDKKPGGGGGGSGDDGGSGEGGSGGGSGSGGSGSGSGGDSGGGSGSGEGGSGGSTGGGSGGGSGNGGGSGSGSGSGGSGEGGSGGGSGSGSGGSGSGEGSGEGGGTGDSGDDPPASHYRVHHVRTRYYDFYYYCRQVVAPNLDPENFSEEAWNIYDFNGNRANITLVDRFRVVDETGNLQEERYYDNYGNLNWYLSYGQDQNNETYLAYEREYLGPRDGQYEFREINYYGDRGAGYHGHIRNMCCRLCPTRSYNANKAELHGTYICYDARADKTGKVVFSKETEEHYDHGKPHGLFTHWYTDPTEARYGMKSEEWVYDQGICTSIEGYDLFLYTIGGTEYSLYYVRSEWTGAERFPSRQEATTWTVALRFEYDGNGQTVYYLEWTATRLVNDAWEYTTHREYL